MIPAPAGQKSGSFCGWKICAKIQKIYETKKAGGSDETPFLLILSLLLALPAPGKTEWSVLEGVGMADGRVQIRLTPDQIRLLSYRVFLAVIL